ncbi:Uncharacterised protein [Mycobacteroides abscessus subsp. abscessus]|uniref:hypothetical protein n=1 Tax=Mycobacteroides abscessus TaxID=36809 RepID=UPI00092AA28A|nr:hypothetical protein [Mycobacteroides abscessus]SII94344.1 Uncharacterised protein [Mycobacteroides abscessus subsp. abscessus]SIL06965.1 Uncharacterised protein [Mycobacteroides abscessus subsp. abscessus]SLK58017.1 Uncharacterised protein [Mycobacteroides abscessus subsp. abscessus]
MSIQIASIVLLNLLVLWLLIENRDLRSENTELRREIARLSKHPSTYEPEPLPYMQRLYADDE